MREIIPLRAIRWLWVTCLLTALVPAARAFDGSDTLVTYLERHHNLKGNDVNGRLVLADWCEQNQLFPQQADLLTEVLKLQPDHVGAYKNLLESDGKQIRPVDKEWAERLGSLLGPGFHLHHSPHFTLLTDTDEEWAMIQGAAMEEAYKTFYQSTSAIGLRPMPPSGRLVCVVFDKYDAYLDFLKRFENVTTPWTAGFYSWQTNRAAFFNDHDSPAFKEIREKIAELEKRVADLREQMDTLGASETAKRIVAQDQLRRDSATLADMTGRLTAAARLATLGKTRHEATHQLLYNSGLQRRGKDYPFWLNEGLATNFELCDAKGNAGPTFTNSYRMKTWRDLENDSKLMPLAEILSHGPAEADETASVAGRYAQVWALVHFLWNKYPDKLQAFMNAMEREPGAVDFANLWAKEFGEDTDRLDGEMRRYIAGL